MGEWMVYHSLELGGTSGIIIDMISLETTSKPVGARGAERRRSRAGGLVLDTRRDRREGLSGTLCACRQLRGGCGG